MDNVMALKRLFAVKQNGRINFEGKMNRECSDWHEIW